MVWTAAQETAFFTEAAQMGLSAAARAALQAEGVTSIDSLAEFSKEQFETIAHNLR